MTIHDIEHELRIQRHKLYCFLDSDLELMEGFSEIVEDRLELISYCERVRSEILNFVKVLPK